MPPASDWFHALPTDLQKRIHALALHLLIEPTETNLHLLSPEVQRQMHGGPDAVVPADVWSRWYHWLGFVQGSFRQGTVWQLGELLDDMRKRQRTVRRARQWLTIEENETVNMVDATRPLRALDLASFERHYTWRHHRPDPSEVEVFDEARRAASPHEACFRCLVAMEV